MPKRQLRQIRVEGNVAYVPLTKGHEAVIDADDVPLVDGYNWHASVQSTTVYAVRFEGPRAKQTLVRLHRVLLGAEDSDLVDHVDGNGLNNRRANIRIANGWQNAQNHKLQRSNSTGLKGVSFRKDGQKWAAEISANDKRYYLGRYATKEEAHAAYRKASAELHGEFVRAG